MKQYKVKHVLETRGTKRNKYGKKMWKILWTDNSVTWESLDNLIDKKYYLIDIMYILKEYKNIAEMYPNSKRKCLCCDKFSNKGILFCKSKKCKFLRKRVEDIVH